jgi:hypothetical protein
MCPAQSLRGDTAAVLSQRRTALLEAATAAVTRQKPPLGSAVHGEKLEKLLVRCAMPAH